MTTLPPKAEGAPKPPSPPGPRPTPPSVGELVANEDPLYDPDISVDSKYRPAFCKIAEVLCGQLGATDTELAEVLGVAPCTITIWRMRHPEFRAACLLADNIIVDRVERALFNRAVGFQHVETKVHFDKLGSVHTFDVMKVYPPDVEAAKFVLTNKSKKWKIKQEITVENPEHVSTDDLLRKLNTGKA